MGCRCVASAASTLTPAVEFDPVNGVQSDSGIVSNWLSGQPSTGAANDFQVNLGDPSNVTGADNAAIIGGFNVTATGFASIGLGGAINLVSGDGSALIAGAGNVVSGATCGMLAGFGNTLSSFNESAMLGGGLNSILGAGVGSARCVIDGGSGNVIDDVTAACGIFVGENNRIDLSGLTSAIVAGSQHLVTGAGSGNVIVGGDQHTIDGQDCVILGGTTGTITGASESAIIAGTASLVTDSESLACCGGQATVGTVRTFAHGTGTADAVGFRGATPIPAPVLSGFLPTGSAPLDATITALIDQGLAA